MTSQPSLGALNPPSRSVRALASFCLSSLSAVAWLRTCLAQEAKRQAPSAMCTPPTTHHQGVLCLLTHTFSHIRPVPAKAYVGTLAGCATANRGRGAHTGDFSFGARRRQRGASCLTSRDPPNGLPPPPGQPPATTDSRRAKSQDSPPWLVSSKPWGTSKAEAAASQL
ncbi:hypothetical protein EDB80DRAFT_3814 [Ilyonectria destructans]|nr:hypothetical protein EDB80DRAFT_3814 [Ilyonectria destructans]